MNTKLKTHLIRQRSLLALLAEGKKTYDIQRYKDLGEMNSEKLWETTLGSAADAASAAQRRAPGR